MSETTEKTARSGEAFMVGIGDTGAILYRLARSIPLSRRADGTWSTGNWITTQAIVDRLVRAGWCVVSAGSGLQGQDELALTDKGWKELFNFALLRSRELAALPNTPNADVDGAAAPESAHSLAYELAAFAFDQARRRYPPDDGDPAYPFGYVPDVGILEGDKPPLEVSEWLNGEKDEPGWKRYARLQALVEAVANASMHGLSLGEMDEFATWAAAMAGEAFRRAPDQDWAWLADADEPA